MNETPNLNRFLLLKALEEAQATLQLPPAKMADHALVALNAARDIESVGGDTASAVSTIQAAIVNGDVAQARRMLADLGEGVRQRLPRFRLLLLDETRHWIDPGLVEKAGRIFGCYLYDEARHVHVADTSPSYELNYLYSTAENEIPEDMQELLLVHGSGGEEVSYSYCRNIDTIPWTHKSTCGRPSDPDADTYNALVAAEVEYYRGNVSIEVPRAPKADMLLGVISEQLDAMDFPGALRALKDAQSIFGGDEFRQRLSQIESALQRIVVFGSGDSAFAKSMGSPDARQLLRTLAKDVTAGTLDPAAGVADSQIVQEARAYDRRLDEAEKAPDGDDYNNLMQIIGVTAAPEQAVEGRGAPEMPSRYVGFTVVERHASEDDARRGLAACKAHFPQGLWALRKMDDDLDWMVGQYKKDMRFPATFDAAGRAHLVQQLQGGLTNAPRVPLIDLLGQREFVRMAEAAEETLDFGDRSLMQRWGAYALDEHTPFFQLVKRLDPPLATAWAHGLEDLRAQEMALRRLVADRLDAPSYRLDNFHGFELTRDALSLASLLGAVVGDLCRNGDRLHGPRMPPRITPTTPAQDLLTRAKATRDMINRSLDKALEDAHRNLTGGRPNSEFAEAEATSLRAFGGGLQQMLKTVIDGLTQTGPTKRRGPDSSPAP